MKRGLLSGVHIQGSLNNPDDVDIGRTKSHLYK
jgi:hypothetical protein